MKLNILILLVGLLSTGAAMAQGDTIRDERNLIPKDPAATPAQGSKDSDLVLIPKDKLPAPLRQALLNEIYAGWESAGVYQRKSTGEYTVEIKTAGGIRKYRFDEKGQPITGMGSAPNAIPN